MIGGEFNDGASVTVYNDIYKWNIDKDEWKEIQAINTPPPRCSHQTVLYRDQVYLFGGRYYC